MFFFMFNHSGLLHWVACWFWLYELCCKL